MSRKIIGASTLLSALFVVNATNAHHPPIMDHCTALTFSGEVERIAWRNPHVELVVVADDGESYLMSWLNPQQLALAGVDQDTISAGERVTVTIGTLEDAVVPRPKLLAAITRLSDGWEWSQTPQGC